MRMCFPSKDYQLRVSFTKNGAVHAANYSKRQHGNPIVVMSACGLMNIANDQNRTRRPFNTHPGTTPITCKRCLKAIGDTDYTKRENTDLFVVRNNDGLFLKDIAMAGYDAQFCEILENAHFFKSRDIAEKYACEYYKESPAVRKIVDSNGNEIPYKKYGRLPYNRSSFRSKLKNGWEIKRVEVKLVD